ncbi:hypothetical protein BKA62DRAFT_683505 [Auriculariales sp. MPI-PUGE-AT-0066]|nr:hypothetical protein BKA62DRAFT_683505 [Auriculariales sp. MPI-PUGE-AT-0066]
MHAKFSSSLLLPLFASAALATSATQCRGSCNVEQHTVVGNQAPHSVHINGPSHLVADISQPSGWEVIGCPTDWSKGSTDVRLVCTNENAAESCEHLLEDGAENTVVRLPAACGTGPFARVARWDVAKDQSIPSGSVADHKLRRRNLKPQVFAARLDYNFAAIPTTRGEVTFDIVAAHSPNIKDQIRSKNVARALRETGHVAINTATVTAYGADATNSLFGIDLPSIDLPSIDLPDIPTELPSIDLPSIDLPSISIPTELPSIDLPSISIPTELPSIDLPSIDLPSISIPTSLPSIDLPDIDFPSISIPDIDIPLPTEFPLPDLSILEGGYEKSGGFEAIKLQGNHSLIDESLGCNFGKIGFDQSAKISMESDILINAGYAFKIAGKLTPPEVTDFALAGTMSGKIHATFDVDMYLSADILLPPIKLLSLGVPGLSIPGLISLGPKVALNVQLDLAVDVAFAASIPVTYDFNKLDFVLPTSLAPSNGEATESKKTSTFEMSVSPGDQTGSIGLHLIPKLEFGIDVLHDLASAEVYIGLDTDITFNSNGTIYPDFSYDGCQDVSIGALAKAGVSAGLFSFFHTGDYIPLYEKRSTIWKHCSNSTDGPTTAVYDNEDGTFTNAGGDLVNENGQLIDENGEVIPDADAADADPAPIKGEDGKDIPEEDLVLDNGDGSYDDAQGNPVNAEGQRISNNGTVLGCELDTSQPLLDADGNTIPPEEAIYDVGDGQFSNGNCDIVNEDGQLVDDDGNVIDYEPFTDDTGAEIPATDVVIDNEDGTYSDPFGNAVDQWGGAMDFDDNGELISVELTPVEEDDGTQEEREPEITDDPAFEIMSPDQLEQLALDLIHGKAPAPSSSESAPEGTTSTEAPSTETTSTDASTTAPADTTSTDAPTTSTDAPSTDTASSSSTTTDAPSEEPTLIPNPIPVPTGACKASSKRSLSSKPGRPQPTNVSRVHMRKRAMLGKRSGFGCSMPSIGGLPLYPAIPGLDQLARLF